jgi:hypothetical protein
VRFKRYVLVFFAPGPAASEPIALADLVGVLRASEITLGPDVGMESPGTPFQPEALNIVGIAAAAQSAWLAVYPHALFGDGTTCVDGLFGQLTGEKSVGVAAFVRDLPGSRAIIFVAADAKSTDTARLFLLTPNTGALVQLASASLRGGIDIYGGTVPPANCNLRPDGAAHMYCQWVRVCLTTAALDQSVTYTGRVWVHGTGLKGDPSRADPNNPALTQIGDTLVWSGPRPTGVDPTGMVGVAGTAIQTAAAMSAVNLTTTGPGTLPPGCEE